MNGFDELIGADVAGAERKRLLDVHELLVAAGPPPELSMALRDAPRPGEVRLFRKQTAPRKVALLAAAIIVLGVAFTVGFATGEKTTATVTPFKTLVLRGTSAEPHAQATLDVQRQVSGNLPMTLTVSGLPRVAAPEYYVVWLVRHGQPFAPCGSFVISKPAGSLTIKLNAPYKLERGDTWNVTRESFGPHSMRTTVLQPVT